MHAGLNAGPGGPIRVVRNTVRKSDLSHTLRICGPALPGTAQA